MIGQMSIYDFLTSNKSDLDDMEEAEMVGIIRNATGIPFEYEDDFWKYRAKIKDVTYAVHYSNYNLHDNKKTLYLRRI